MKITVPDLVSNSYFLAIAAVELGFFKEEGLDMTWDLVYPGNKTCEALRDGQTDFIAGPAHMTLSAFPAWQSTKILCALAHGMYWMLVMRADLKVKRGDVAAVKGRRIGAAPYVDICLKQLLKEAGIDVEKDGVRIAPAPGAAEPGISFGVTAAKALEAGKIDGFWANAMGAEVAVQRGVGTVVLDVRRGDGPPGAFHYTMPVLTTTDRLLASNPQAAGAAVRAIVKTQRALKGDVRRATEVGRRLFPPEEAELIAELIARDLPYYNPTITEDAVIRINRFAQDAGLLAGPVPYAELVATQFSPLWSA